MRDRDVIYISNADTVEVSKFLELLNLASFNSVNITESGNAAKTLVRPYRRSPAWGFLRYESHNSRLILEISLDDLENFGCAEQRGRGALSSRRENQVAKRCFPSNKEALQRRGNPRARRLPLQCVRSGRVLAPIWLADPDNQKLLKRFWHWQPIMGFGRGESCLPYRQKGSPLRRQSKKRPSSSPPERALGNLSPALHYNGTMRSFFRFRKIAQSRRRPLHYHLRRHPPFIDRNCNIKT